MEHKAYTPKAQVGDFYWVRPHARLRIFKIEDDTRWCQNPFGRDIAIRFDGRHPSNQPENVDVWLTHSQIRNSQPGTGSGLTKNRVSGQTERFIVYHLNTPNPDPHSQDRGHIQYLRNPEECRKSYRQEAIERFFSSWTPVLEGIPYSLELDVGRSTFGAHYKVRCARTDVVIGRLGEDLIRPGYFHSYRGTGQRSSTSTFGLTKAANLLWGYREGVAV